MATKYSCSFYGGMYFTRLTLNMSVYYMQKYPPGPKQQMQTLVENTTSNDDRTELFDFLDTLDMTYNSLSYCNIPTLKSVSDTF